MFTLCTIPDVNKEKLAVNLCEVVTLLHSYMVVASVNIQF